MIDQIYLLLYISAILLAISFSIETCAFEMRDIGISFDNPGLGYSLHVQLATLARTLNFIALPFLGLLLDSGVQVKLFLQLPIIFGFTFIISSVAYLRLHSRRNLAEYVFKILAKHISRLEINFDRKNKSSEKVMIIASDLNNIRKIRNIGAIAAFFTVGGTLTPFILGSILNDYRASMLQLSPLFTALGTILSVSYFDPRISFLMREDGNNELLIQNIIIGRSIGVGFLMLLAIVLYVWI